MKRETLFGPVILIFSLILALSGAGCFSNNIARSAATTAAKDMVIPQPQVESVIATTSGTRSAYYATLDIKVKNLGAEGTILVQAEIIQNGISSSNEMPVFLKQNETHQLKLTFPLVWQGGAFTSNVKAIVP